MIGRIPRWFLFVGIVTAPIACDNVSWGGMKVSLEPPPGDTLEGSGEPVEAEPGRIEYGPLLYAGTRTGDSAVMVPVAELVGGSLQALPLGEEGVRLAGQILEERFAAGQRFNLFHGGTRVGTFTVTAPGGVTQDLCPPRAQARGYVELIPSATSANRFMALEEGLGPALRTSRPYSPGVTPSRVQRNAAQNLAGQALNELRAPWPPALQNIRRDLQVFQAEGDQGPGVAATFLYLDDLATGPADDDAYALFILGEPRSGGMQRTFTWYRPVGTEGKGAPRLFSWMDWDGDGREEALLEVFGSQARWWAALERGQDGTWSAEFEDACSVPGGPS